ncbi:hypothetical protein VMCG_09215 [Cytospora schulzeri]|uniref:Uncharacterized protein n=1 Tax=Cytospora schulzeri TaxID=448051 RepID=A0A423VLL6_9PEZI|nr:hypothetical protein VMCG_09215 [Valsa malicola]
MPASNNTPATATAIPAKWHLPKVPSWEFLEGEANVDNPVVLKAFKGNVDFKNEENRTIRIYVHWNLPAISQMPGNINKLIKGSQAKPNDPVPPATLDMFKRYTEHYAVEEAARLGGLDVRIMATMHEFTKGSGMTTEMPDHLHLTLNVRTSEWGQKKVHLYLKDWRVPQKPLSAIVFVKDHNTLGEEYMQTYQKDIHKYRAFWHRNLSYGHPPAWMAPPGQTLESDDTKRTEDLVAYPSYLSIEKRVKLFNTAVDKATPLKSIVSEISQHRMYTRYSHIVERTFGKDKGKHFQMDYQVGKWREMRKDPQTQSWAPVPPSAPAGRAGGSNQ